MEATGTLDDPEEIRSACEKLIQEESQKFASKKEQGLQSRSAATIFNTSEVIAALNRNEDGDAWLFIELHRGSFCYDTAQGRWYLWQGHYWIEDRLGQAMQSVNAVIEVYGKELIGLSACVNGEVLDGTAKLQ